MATVASGINSGSGFSNSDTITSTTLNNHVNDATVTNIQTGDIASSSSKTTGVTFEKMQHISTSKILGRTTAGEGDVEEVSLLDEDDMSSDSATAVATQQSIKAYINDFRPNIVVATKNDTETLTFSSLGEVKDVANLEVTITPRRDGSTFICSGHLSAGFTERNRDFGVNVKYKVNSESYQDFNLPSSPGDAITPTEVAQSLLDIIYPVGSIYTNATDSTNPGTLLGFGTWVEFAEGRVPVGKASSGTFDTAGNTGGNETTTTTTVVPIDGYGTTGGGIGTVGSGRMIVGSGIAEFAETLESLRAAGNTQTITSSNINVVQPYIVVYMWKRTA
jgi:hypothetical protein